MTRGFKLTACTLSAIAVHAVIFVGTYAGLRAANAALKAYGPADVGSVEWSHRYYYDYASATLAGKIPYRDFAFEYPVLSYPLFLIPRLLVSDFESYRYAFVAEMFLFDVAAIVLIARHGGEPTNGSRMVARRQGWYTLYCFLLAPLVIGRFELAPMVLAFAAARWWFSDRAILGGITAGLGTLMKILSGRGGGAGPGVGSLAAADHAGPGDDRVSGNAGGGRCLLVLAGGYAGAGIAELPCRTRPGSRVALRRSTVSRWDDHGGESSVGFRPQRVPRGVGVGSKTGDSCFPAPGRGDPSRSCGASGDRGWPTVRGSRQPRCSRSSSSARCYHRNT